MHDQASDRPGDVLIVEDEHPIADLLEAFLTEEGYHVRSARDAEAGWRAVQSAKPALLLLDLLLPGTMSGAELAQKLRAEGYTFPIIAIPATERLAHSILHLTPIESLAKPFDLETLLSIVARYVQPARPDKPPSPAAPIVLWTGPACTPNS